MPITTYAELKTAIADWGKRSDVTVSTTVTDTFIDLAEADIWRELRIRDMETRATGSLSGASLALPSDFLESRKFRLTTTPPRELTYVTPESMTKTTSSGFPNFYTITDQIEFEKTPGGTYGYELTYYKSLTALSSNNTSNAVLTRYPNIYLFGSLAHYFDWSQNEPMHVKYAAKFQQAVQQANKSDRRGRYPSGAAGNKEGSTP